MMINFPPLLYPQPPTNYYCSLHTNTCCKEPPHQNDKPRPPPISHTPKQPQTSWSRLCQGGGRASDGRHIGRVVRLAAASPDFPVAPTASTLGLIRHFCGSGDDMELLQQQRRSRALKWKDEYPRSRYRGDFFKPPLFDDEPSDSDEDESQQQQQQQQQHGGGGTSSSAAAHLPASDDVGTKEGK